MPTCSTGIQSVSLKPATDIAVASSAPRAQLYSCCRAAAFRLGCGPERVSVGEVSRGGDARLPVQARQVVAVGSRCGALTTLAPASPKNCKSAATARTKRVLPDSRDSLHLKSPATDDENDRVARIAGVRVVDEGGVTALGVPIGSDAFVREAMRQKSQGAQDKVNCVKARLAEYSKQDFRILLVRCLAPLLDYWMRSVPPSLSTPYLEAFDGCLEAAHRVTLGASGREIYEEELLSVRARLPDRLKGLALRRRAETAPEAFCSCVLAVAQALFDIGGPVARELFGVEKLATKERGRFAIFLQKRSKLAREFEIC